VVSMAPTNPRISEYDEAVEMLKEYEHLSLVNSIIRERKVYRDAIVEGKGVLEMNDLKAKEEFLSLIKEI
jgi:chromosome partitioning protein